MAETQLVSFHDVLQGSVHRTLFVADDIVLNQEQQKQCLSPVVGTEKFSFCAEHLKNRIKALDGRNKQEYRLLVTKFLKLALYCSERLNCDDVNEDDTTIAFYLNDWKTTNLYRQIDINCRLCASTRRDFEKKEPESQKLPPELKKLLYLCQTRMINIGWMILFLWDLHSVQVGDVDSFAFYHRFIKHIDAFLADCFGASNDIIYGSDFYKTHEISWQQVNDAMNSLVVHFDTLLELISSSDCDRWYWAYFYEGWEQYVFSMGGTADNWKMEVSVIPEASYQHRKLFWDVAYQK